MYLPAAKQMFKNISTYVCQLWSTFYSKNIYDGIIIKVLSFSPITGVLPLPSFAGSSPPHTSVVCYRRPRPRRPRRPAVSILVPDG
jgi:hypothetical protein